MAHCKLVFACLFLVLIFPQEIRSIEGRHLKLEGKNGFPKLKTYKKFPEKELRKLFEDNSNFHGDGDTVRATYDSVFPPTAPSVGVGEAQPSPPGHADNFRPTVPGHSPGVGHSLQN